MLDDGEAVLKVSPFVKLLDERKDVGTLVLTQHRLLLVPNNKANPVHEVCALDEIVEQAQRRKSGARGLRSVIERLMLKVMYEVPDHSGARQCVIDATVVRGERDAQVIARESSA